MYEFGRNLGLAFQIQDDLLDVFGNQEEFGKTIGGDLAAGKKTFLILKALELNDGRFTEELNAFFSNKGIGSGDVCRFREIFEQTGAKSEAEEIF
jgi:geranylgeranyl diphosphate synthase type II